MWISNVSGVFIFGMRVSGAYLLCYVRAPRMDPPALPHCFPPLCSFFEALEQRHREQVCVEDISDILEEHAEHHFHPYVSYCANEVYQQRALQKLT